MTKKELQEYLSNYKDDKELFVMWWSKEFLSHNIDEPVTDEEWKKVVNNLDDYGFGIVNEEIHRAMENELEDVREK